MPALRWDTARCRRREGETERDREKKNKNRVKLYLVAAHEGWREVSREGKDRQSFGVSERWLPEWQERTFKKKKGSIESEKKKNIDKGMAGVVYIYCI